MIYRDAPQFPHFASLLLLLVPQYLQVIHPSSSSSTTPLRLLAFLALCYATKTQTTAMATAKRETAIINTKEKILAILSYHHL
jgi:hypothetical protein